MCVCVCVCDFFKLYDKYFFKIFIIIQCTVLYSTFTILNISEIIIHIFKIIIHIHILYCNFTRNRI